MTYTNRNDIELERARLSLEKEKLELEMLRKTNERREAQDKAQQKGTQAVKKLFFGLLSFVIVILLGALTIGGFSFIFEPLYGLYVGLTGSNPINLDVSKDIGSSVRLRTSLSTGDISEILLGAVISFPGLCFIFFALRKNSPPS